MRRISGQRLIRTLNRTQPEEGARARTAPGAALLEVMIAIVLAGLLLTPLARGTAHAFHQFTIAAARDNGSAAQARALAMLRADPCAGDESGEGTVGNAHVAWSAVEDSTGVRALGATVTSAGGEHVAGGADSCP